MSSNPKAPDTEESGADCADYFKALADPVRLQIVRALRAGPLNVSDLALLLELDIAKTSHHLRVLYHADIVTIAKDGKYSYYNLNADFLKNKKPGSALDFGCCKVDLRD